ESSLEYEEEFEESWPEEEEEIDLEESWPEEEDQEESSLEYEEEFEESRPKEEETAVEEPWSGEETQRQVYENRKRKKGRRKRSRRYRRRRVWINRKIFDIAVLCVFLTVLYLWNRPKVVRELEVEAGSSVPELSEFLLREYKDACFTQEWEEILDMNQVADYEIGITIAGEEYTSLLHVTDTTAPIVEAKKVQAYQDHVLEPMDFVEKIEDATETEVTFAERPDFTIPGDQKVELLVTDEGGNVTQVSTEMEIVVDTEPPVIEGVEELTVAIGESISYKKNVTVSDNYDENVTLEIDSSQVDLNARGDYPVVYRAEDGAGNVTEEETVVHVKAASVETATEEMVNKKADEILQKITTEDMSQYEIAKKIFDWVHGNIGWSDGVPKTNWIQGAYRGLFDQKGDCYVYASAAKCLLTRAGIENMDIGFSSARRSHYWNLIDLGEGWYHFDATRRTDGRSFFYYEDADIRAYSSTHNGSHAYDPSQYPDIQ
ncbi:MAG: hypothetical protein HFH41_00005, partial [Lachnospiraceae bacterium]|nr:hypothetical protein [Lachnospiraceae bacterium]